MASKDVGVEALTPPTADGRTPLPEGEGSVLRVLDLGSGDSEVARRLFEGCELVRVDLNPETEPDVLADVRALPEDLGVFDVVFASHILEHLARLEVLPTLKHWAGCLVEGGTLHVLVPDLVWACEEVVRSGVVTIPTMLHIYGSQQDALRCHRVGFTVGLLRNAVQQAGLQVVHATVGPYQLIVNRDDADGPGESRAVEARQIYVVGRRAG